ncbi:hypothetical protein CBM2592_A90022 [Cupriavidus taiwanensis]|nr:hypothetical protein CBM2592_A90022 [Cupriavidus taiwanensis]SPD41560.1 protein of unknown function [Cupriavidus taiwanensis]
MATAVVRAAGGRVGRDTGDAARIVAGAGAVCLAHTAGTDRQGIAGGLMAELRRLSDSAPGRKQGAR